MFKDFTASGYEDSEAAELMRSTREGHPPICPQCSHPMTASSAWERRVVLSCENQYCTGDKVVFSRVASATAEQIDLRLDSFLRESVRGS